MRRCASIASPRGPKLVPKFPKVAKNCSARQQVELAELVDAGPHPAVHGVVRWRRVSLRDELQWRFGVALHERSVGKVLAKLGYRKLSVRPRHPRADEEAQETFKKNFAVTVTAQIPDRATGKPIEIWFQML
jgi:putative transposase